MNMEQSLRARIRDGDPDAFGTLFDEHSRAVCNLAFRLTGDWTSAEEVTSLTFLEAWRLRAEVELTGESLRPWLMGIAVNVCRNTSRAARRYRAAMARLPQAPVVPDFADELAERIDDTAQLAKVRRALRELRPGEQDVVALCVWSGLDYAAAAQALGIPIGTVRSRLSRARSRLRKSIGEPGAASEQVEGSRENAARQVQGRIR
jgi:RNA polymerase sigma factor (sigma-70 family)